MHKRNVNGMIILYQIVMIRSNSCNRLSPGKKVQSPFDVWIHQQQHKSESTLYTFTWMTEPSLHSLQESIHGLSESFTYSRRGGHEQNERSEDEYFLFQSHERVWLTLSTQHWRTSLSIHSSSSENTHTQLVYRKHLDTITRSAERTATVFVAAGVRGRENKQGCYLHTGKKEKLTPIPPHGSLTNMGVTEPIERERERKTKRDESCVSSTTSMI